MHWKSANRFINWIKNHGGGWKGKDAARHIGKKFVTAIWYIDSCSVKTLDQKFKIPVIFDEFFGRSFPENYKRSRPKFNSEELAQHSKEILNYVCYSSGLFKEVLCFNCGVECKEHTNYGGYFPYCKDCNILVKIRKEVKEELYIQ